LFLKSSDSLYLDENPGLSSGDGASQDEFAEYFPQLPPPKPTYPDWEFCALHDLWYISRCYLCLGDAYGQSSVSSHSIIIAGGTIAGINWSPRSFCSAPGET